MESTQLKRKNMDDLLKNARKNDLLCGEGQNEEVAQALAIIQRFTIETLPQYSDREQMCGQLARVIIEETSFHNCSILFHDYAENKLFLVSAYGLADQLGVADRPVYNKNLSFRFGEGIAGNVFNSQKAIFIENTIEEPIPQIKGTVIAPVSLISIPLRQIGVLNVSAFHPQKFTAKSRRSWEVLAKIIGSLLSVRRCSQKEKKVLRPHPMNVETIFPSAKRSSCPSSDLILDSLPQGICILDQEGKVVVANRTMETKQGDGLALSSRSPALIFKDPKLFENLLTSAANSDSGVVEESEANLMNSAGETYLAHLNLIRFADEPSGLLSYLLIINDISQEKAFSEKIFQTEKLAALGTMAGGVSHDFNNLLMAILGHVQLLTSKVKDEEVLRRFKNIEKAVYEGSNTIRRLQMFTERDLDPKAKFYRVDVAEAVKDVMELTRSQWKNSMERSGCKIDIQTDLEPNCFAAIKSIHLRDILTNLLLNAIDAMPQGGTLTFHSHCSGEHVVIEISDDGTGMPEEVAGKIFDPFFTTKGVGNSGLGLSVSWNLIKGSGGDIQVKSKPGQGTKFVIKFVQAEALKTQPVASTTERTGCYRLLLIDDDPAILNILRDMLRLKGHKVIATVDGEKALELIDTGHFDLVLTDLMMPVVSGWEIAKRTKARNEKTPVVMITGWGAQYEEEDLASKGVDLMLTKPLSWESLMGAIQKMLVSVQPPLLIF